MPDSEAILPIVINPETQPAVIPDTGCEAPPSYLACPLPECRYDNPTDTQAAQRFGPHTRTIGRILSHNRAA